MLYRFYLTLVVIVFLPFIAISSPTVRFGPAPSWVVPATAPEWAPDSRDVNDGYYIGLFEDQFNVGKEQTYQHVVRSIISDAGVQAASNISINFNPSYEQLTVHSIIVWRDGKQLDKLKKNGFKVLASEEDLSRFIYNGSYSAYIILEDIRRGDKIEYAYTITGYNPIFKGKYHSSFSLQGAEPISRIHYRLLTPATRTLAFRYINDAAKPVASTMAGDNVYEWDAVQVKGRTYSDNTPRWYNPMPEVQVSEYKDWHEVAAWAYNINIPQAHLQGDIGRQVALFKAQYGSDSGGLLRAAVNMVQNEVRYMGVEIGSYSHQANAPQKVYDQRYGDCKDKSLLLVSVLRDLGIAADMALVSSYAARINDDIPSPASFNHAIVVAHVGGHDVWIDPTLSNQGGTGASFYTPSYGHALVLRPETTSLTLMPESTGGSIKYNEEYVGTNIDSPVSLVITTVFRGSAAEDIRETFANTGKASMEKSYIDYYSKIFTHITATDTLSVADDKPGNIFTTTERYSIADFFEYDAAKSSYSCDFYARLIRERLPTLDAQKNDPISVSYPCSITCNTTLRAPFALAPETIGDDISRTAYDFSYRVSAQGSLLSLTYRFNYKKDHIPVADIARYQEDRKVLVDNYLYYSLSHTPGKETLAARSDSGYLNKLAVVVLITGFVHIGVRNYRRRRRGW